MAPALNLTAASHGIHYDRWWNPVHKLVCGGTVEEGIDALIRGKRELAERVVASQWWSQRFTSVLEGYGLGCPIAGR